MGVVCDLDRLGFIRYPEQAGYRTEELLTVGAHGGCDSAQNRRRIEKTIAIDFASTTNQAGTLRQRIAHLFMEFVTQVAARHRRECRCGIGRVPRLQRRHCGDLTRLEHPGYGCRDDEALCRDTTLPGVHEARLDRF